MERAERSRCSGRHQVALQTKSEKYAPKPYPSVVALQPSPVKDPAAAFYHVQLAEQGFVLNYEHVSKIELEDVAAPQARMMDECPQ